MLGESLNFQKTSGRVASATCDLRSMASRRETEEGFPVTQVVDCINQPGSSYERLLMPFA